MRIFFILVIVASLVALSFIPKHKAAAKKKEAVSLGGSYAPVAVLELFTSEGCSSCPPADRLLPELATLDSNVIPLSFHVDYWNQLGWRDPFSSSEFSERQREYGQEFHLESVYTPQLVIDGEYEQVGSNRAEASNNIKKALMQNAAVRIDMEEVRIDGMKLQVDCRVMGDLKKTILLAALVQKQATTNVKAGENNGARLSHTNVVRVFTQKVALPKTDFQLDMPKDLADGNWQLIVYAQRENDLRITGATIYNKGGL